MSVSIIKSVLASLLVVMLSVSCEKPESGLIIPGSGQNVDQGQGGEDKPQQGGALCTDIGQTPIVLCYYTEYSEELPDINLVTHVNYAHGRFKDPANGDGGIVISNVSLMKKVVALKDRNPKLKVLLMIGGWGMAADGFSMMARDSKKRTTFCQSVKSLLEQYKLDGVDIDWEYPTYSAEGTGAHQSDKYNFNLVLQELREALGTGKIISFYCLLSADNDFGNISSVAFYKLYP